MQVIFYYTCREYPSILIWDLLCLSNSVAKFITTGLNSQVFKVMLHNCRNQERTFLSFHSFVRDPAEYSSHHTFY